MSWAKMCKCFCCCKKKKETQDDYEVKHHEPIIKSSAVQVTIPSHHKYTSTMIDIHGALATPIAS